LSTRENIRSMARLPASRGRFVRDDHPRQNIADQDGEDGSNNGENHCRQADDRRVEVHVLRDAAADAPNFLVRLRKIESFHGKRPLRAGLLLICRI